MRLLKGLVGEFVKTFSRADLNDSRSEMKDCSFKCIFI